MNDPDRPTDLDAWVLETAPRATAYARSLLRDPHAADDVVQDCYCRLLAKAGEYDLPADGLKLLLRAITNASINATTRRRKWLAFGRDDDDPGGAAEPADARALPADAGLRHAELASALAAGLRALPVPQRAAVELKSLGHTQAEIADILGVSASNAGVLIHRGRTALAAFLGPLYPGEDAS